jgi:hypothetical protein
MRVSAGMQCSNVVDAEGGTKKKKKMRFRAKRVSTRLEHDFFLKIIGASQQQDATFALSAKFSLRWGYTRYNKKKKTKQTKTKHRVTQLLRKGWLGSIQRKN